MRARQSKMWGCQLFPAKVATTIGEAAAAAVVEPLPIPSRNNISRDPVVETTMEEEQQHHPNNAAYLEMQAKRAAQKAEAMIRMAEHKQHYLDVCCFPKLDATRKLQIQEDIAALEVHAQALSHQAQELAVQAERRHLEEGLARSKLCCNKR